jgi:hypothetical protein
MPNGALRDLGKAPCNAVDNVVDKETPPTGHEIFDSVE